MSEHGIFGVRLSDTMVGLGLHFKRYSGGARETCYGGFGCAVECTVSQDWGCAAGQGCQ